MLKNYLKISLRNLLKNKVYTFINLTGLTVGIACCLLLFFYVQFELSYDKHHSKIDCLYRISSEYTYDGKTTKMSLTPSPLANALKAEFPEVEKTLRIHKRDNVILSHGDKSSREKAVAFADASLFELFDIKLIQGDPARALKEPNTLLLSETLARKLFGKEDPTGKLMLLNNQEAYQVTGVYKDITKNSHYHFNLIGARSGIEDGNSNSWNFVTDYTYLLIKKGTHASALEAKLPLLLQKYQGSSFQKYLAETGGSGNITDYRRYRLLPVKDIHLYSDFEREIEAGGNINYVYLFSALAFIILVIACINYMNLSTARSAERAKEIGIRKVSGARRPQLIAQFLSESLLLSVLALILALGIVEIAIKGFNQLLETSIQTQYLGNFPLLITLGGIILLVGFLAGSYPAFYISAFDSAKILKGNLKMGIKSGKIRSGLVITQFVLSIFLMVGAVTIYKQLFFIRHTNFGYNKEQVLIIKNQSSVLNNTGEVLKKEILQFTSIKSATLTNFLPVELSSSKREFFSPEGQSDKKMVMNEWTVDHNYLKTLGMEIKKGRFFSPEFSSDSTAVVINEEAANQLGFDGIDPVGKRINYYKGSFKIIGVVKNFNFQSLKEKIAPLVMSYGRGSGFLCIRMNEKNTAQTLNLIKDHWDKLNPGFPFEYTFLDEAFDQMYKKEQKIGKILLAFALLAIFIACLGLFGLSAFTIQQRVKEIGIRKVLGASIKSIVVLLSKEFGKLVGIAFVLASPFAWWTMNEWLQNFKYKTTLGPEVFLGVGFLSFLVAWLTMSFHAIKAATDNPVSSIRYE
ncbi:ABC transporter permease [Xanthovirga aplysinae]|uniref:ABC transporter permease n=1 Tax=Xanthovirga aplysinae TaxID=2529853 RepID=UPI0012BCEA66|nr:ABC transporter permease [Xanthovirga aplysinae]MTI30354.1 ABC transporter permease [Xanthovirga aplysinae]